MFQASGDAALVASLRQQLSTLTSSLQTLTVERSKMEANFQKDKKSALVRKRERREGEERGGRGGGGGGGVRREGVIESGVVRKREDEGGKGGERDEGREGGRV